MAFNDTLVEVIAATAPAKVGDAVVTADTGAQSVATNGWTYLQPGAIASASPSSGQIGTRVTVEGARLFGGGATVAAAYLNGVAATVLQAANNSFVVLQAAAAPAGTGSIRLVADSGAEVERNATWTYLEAGNITRFTPAQGSNGTLVTITGDRLLGGASALASVTLNGVEVRDIVSQNDSVVVVQADGAPAAANTVIRLEAATGAVTATTGWRYVGPTVISSVSPVSGQLGTRVTIDGSNLLGGASSLATVFLAGVATSEFVQATDTRVVAVAASGSGSGSVDLVAASGARASASSPWQYLTASTVAAVDPAAGVWGTRVTITGQRLLGGGTSIVGATFGTVAVEQIISFNDTMVVVAAGNSSAQANMDVTLVANTGAISVKTGAWTFQTPPVITRIAPEFGQLGTRVTVYGTNLLSYGSVLASASLSGQQAAIASFNNTMVVLVASASNSQTGDVRLTADTGGRAVGVGLWEYRPDGRVLAVSPASGQGGTDVILFGENMLGHGAEVVSVKLANVTAAVSFFSNTIIQVKAGSTQFTGAGGIEIVMDTGAVVARADGWTYLPQGTIDAVTPSSGHLGTYVEITGSNLLGGGSRLQSVSLAGSLADILAYNNTYIRVRATRDSGIKPGDVTITTNTAAQVIKANAWTYVDPGDVDLVSPAQGQAGTRVTLKGQNLLAGGSTATSVTLAGVEVQQVVSASNTEVVVVAAAANASTGNIVITVNTGAFVVQQNGWTYITPAAITVIAPTSGQHGTLVYINGTNLLGGGSAIANATLANTPVFSIVQASNTQVVVRAGADGTGAGNVVLFADTGAVITSSLQFTYLVAGNITAVAPTQGQGGTVVTVTGERLRGGGTAVVAATLAGVSASVAAEADDQVVVRAGAGPASTLQGHVVLTADTGALVTLENGWTYLAAGVITQVAPSSGQEGTVVTIDGARLLGGGSEVTNVTIGGVNARVVQANATRVVAVAGASAAPAAGATVAVISDTGAVVQLTGAFSYLLAGEITAVAPGQGQGGTFVNISGTGLRGGGTAVAQVLLGGVAATIVAETNTLVTVRAGAAANVTGDVDVVLTADTGATVTLAAGFEYVAAGAIAAVSPSSGQVGTRVTVTGAALRGGGAAVTSMTLNGVEVQQIVLQNDTMVVGVAAAGVAAANAAVRLTANTGAVVELAGAWTHLTAGAISAVVPASGQVGTRVELQGTGLLGGGAAVAQVLFGSSPATVVAANDTLVVVRPGNGSHLVGSSVDVTVISDSGSSVTKTQSFAYLQPSTITRLVPSDGQWGTFVRIQGTGLLGYGSSVTAVSLAGVPVLEISSASNTEVLVRAGESFVLGPGDAVVQSDTGAQAVLADGWTYAQASNITDVNVCF